MLRKEGGEFAPGVFGRSASVRSALVAEKAMVRIRIDLQGVLLAKFLEPGLDLPDALEGNERVGIAKEQVDGHFDVGCRAHPLIQDHTIEGGRRPGRTR